MNNLTKLTIKYFIKQKYEEIKEWFEDFWFFSLFAGFISQIFWMPIEEGGEPVCPLVAKIGLVILSIYLLVGIYLFLKVIYNWLKDNWTKAKERAKEELQ